MVSLGGGRIQRYRRIVELLEYKDPALRIPVCWTGEPRLSRPLLPNPRRLVRLPVPADEGDGCACRVRFWRGSG